MSKGTGSQMAADDEIITRYLLGELSEGDQLELERQFFADAALVDRMTEVEAQILDAYARGGVSIELREHVARRYRGHPTRRARLEFANALAHKLDELSAAATSPLTTVGLLARSTAWWQGPGRIAGFSLAIAIVVLVVITGGLLVERIRLREELNRTQTARVAHEARARDLQAQLDMKKQADARILATELDRLRAAPDPQPVEPRQAPSRPTVVTLLLTIGGVRGLDSDAVRPLRIPPGASQVRFQLDLDNHDHQRYQVVLQAVGGNTVLERQDLRPDQTRSGWRLVVTVPSARVPPGDYVLTLGGVTRIGDVDVVSKSIVRIEP